MADFQNFGAWHIATNPKLYSPQRDNTFVFIVEGLDDLVRAGAIGTESKAKFTNAQEVLRVSLKECPIPHYSQEVITINKGNTQAKFAGRMNFDSGSFTFDDFMGADTKSILMAWQNLSGNIYTETVGNDADYKKTGTLIECTPDFKTVRTWKLYGCWISGLSEDPYSNDGTGAKKISCTIQYDKAVIDVQELD